MFNKVKVAKLQEAFEEATKPFNRKRIESCDVLIQELITPVLEPPHYDPNDYIPSEETIISSVDMGISHLKAKRFSVLLRAAEILVANAKKKLTDESLTYNWLVVEPKPGPPADRLGFQLVVGINQNPVPVPQ